MRRIVVSGLVLLLIEISSGIAQAATTIDKSQYHLLNPTPREEMRDMSTDRPDKTESPYTVDAGHYQIEMSFADYTYDHRNLEHSDERIDNFSVAPINLKVGLLNNVDIQLIIAPYIRERSAGDEEKEVKSGFGDIQSRLKVNLWGNDEGSTAFAVMPFIKFPTSTGMLGNDAVEGGIIIPLAVSLPADWGLGLMTEFDFNRNSEKDYYTDFINTITLDHDIVGHLDGYVEFFSSVNCEDDSPWVGTVDVGLTFAVSENIQLDSGVNIGVTRSADDFNPFWGCSIRY